MGIGDVGTISAKRGGKTPSGRAFMRSRMSRISEARDTIAGATDGEGWPSSDRREPSRLRVEFGPGGDVDCGVLWGSSSITIRPPIWVSMRRCWVAASRCSRSLVVLPRRVEPGEQDRRFSPEAKGDRERVFDGPAASRFPVNDSACRPPSPGFHRTHVAQRGDHPFMGRLRRESRWS